MNILKTQEYFQNQLPDFSIRFEENYKGQKNTRFIFEQNGVDAAVLIANSLEAPDNFYDKIATAVRKKFEKSPVEAKIAEVKEAVQSAPLADNPVIASVNKVSYDLYFAAKKVVETYESENPMT